MKPLILALLLVPFAVAAQNTPAPPPAPNPSSTPNFCDVTYAVEVETSDNFDVSSASLTARADPWVDVAADHERQVKILNVLSKEQNKGGPYSITVTETNACDGGNVVRVASGSLYVEGVTLEGSVKVVDMALQMAKEVNDRYRERAKKGATVGWNHKNAAKVKRDDLGRKIGKRGDAGT